MLAAAVFYAACKFIEEPEFGSLIGFGAIMAGGVIAIGLLVLSIIVATTARRNRAAKEAMDAVRKEIENPAKSQDTRPADQSSDDFKDSNA